MDALTIPALLSELESESDIESRPAVSFYRGSKLRSRLSCREMLATIARVRSACDALPTGPIAVLGRNGVETACIYLGVISAGAVLVPLNPDASDESCKEIIEISGARSLIVDPEASAHALETSFPVAMQTYAEVLSTAAVRTERRSLSECDLALILFSSGTTGEPKGIPLSHGNLLANARGLVRHFKLEREVQLAIMPLCHSHAFGFGLLTSLISRSHLILMQGLDPFAWANVIRREQVTVSSLVPSLLAMLLKLNVTAISIPTLRALLVSSAPLPIDLATRFIGSTGIRLVHGWGLSEYTNFATCIALDLADDDYRELMLRANFPSVGRALEGTEVQILTSEGESASAGVEGELLVRGPCRMRGYLLGREPAALTEDGWLRTGDLGFFRDYAFGRYYYVSGRKKELIIRGGEKISPIALERKWADILPREAGSLIAVGFDHSVFGEEIGAYLELAGGPLPSEDSIRSQFDTLHVLERPKIIVAGTDAVPKTFTGKILRRQLKARFAAFTDYVGPLRVVPADATNGNVDGAD